jgi:hypothetical protein
MSSLLSYAESNAFRSQNSVNYSIPQIKEAYAGLTYGIVQACTRENHALQVYDVMLMEAGGTTISAVAISSITGGGGAGEFRRLRKGDVAIVGFRKGNLNEGYILGIQAEIPGNYSNRFNLGYIPPISAQSNSSDPKWGTSTYNTNDHASFLTHGIDGHWNGYSSYFNGTYDDPQNHTSPVDAKTASPQFSGVDYRINGDKVTYCNGANITYAESNISVLQGTTETIQTRLLSFARYYCDRAAAYVGGTPLTIDANTTSQQVKDQIAPLTKSPAVPTIAPSGLVGRGFFSQAHLAMRELDLCAAFIDEARNAAACGAVQQVALANMSNSATNPTNPNNPNTPLNVAAGNFKAFLNTAVQGSVHPTDGQSQVNQDTTGGMWSTTGRLQSVTNNIIIAPGHAGNCDASANGCLYYAPPNRGTHDSNSIKWGNGANGALQTDVTYIGHNRTLESAILQMLMPLMQNALQNAGFNVSIVNVDLGHDWDEAYDIMRQNASGNNAFTIEFHFTDYNESQHSGVLPPNIATGTDKTLSGSGISAYDIALSQGIDGISGFGAYSQDWRDTLAGPRRGVTLLELGRINDQNLETLVRSALGTPNSASAQQQVNAILTSYSTKVASLLQATYKLYQSSTTTPSTTITPVPNAS